MVQQAASVTEASAGKWVIAGTVVLSSFVSVMEFSIVNMAMPQMISTIDVSLDAITWVAVSYSIAAIILITMSAWLSRFFGRNRYFVWSFIMLIVIPIAGRLYNYVDTRLLVGCGVALMVIGYLDMSGFTPEVGLPQMLPSFLLTGAGMAFMFGPLSAVVMRTVPLTMITAASSLYTLLAAASAATSATPLSPVK
jgi:MFS family permease